MLQFRFQNMISRAEQDLADLQKAAAKTNQEIAESLEIMTLELRPVGETRDTLRGAICMIREEPTNVSKEKAIFLLTSMVNKYTQDQRPARALICNRAIGMIG